MMQPEKQPFEQYEVVECDWLTDILEEKFDDAMSLLEEGCIIYGGAIRDIFAGMPLRGDLDIGVPNSMFRHITANFNNSNRWINKSHVLPHKNSGIPTTAKKVISNVNTYQNINGDTVQLIAPVDMAASEIQGIDFGLIDIVLNVDIVCCGLLSDIFGTVYEIVPGAVEDCKNRVLNFNGAIKITPTSIDRLNERIKKLKIRGWKSEIDVSKIKTIKEEPAPVFPGLRGQSKIGIFSGKF